MPKSTSSFYTSNMSLASERGLEMAKDFVKGSLKALNIGGSAEHRITPECEQPILKSSGSELSVNGESIHGWTPLLMLTGMATNLGCSIPVGYNIGVMNTPAQIIREFCNTTVEATYGISMSSSQLSILWSTLVSIFLVGGVTGSLTGGWVADKFGRKGAVVVSSVLGGLAALFFFTSRQAGSVEMLLLARLIVGLSSGLTTTVIPMYLTEIAPLSIRGAMGVLCPLGLNVGVVIAQILGLKQILGTMETWHYLLSLYVLLILVSAIALPFLPESPKYLYVVRGEEEKGISELSRLRGVSVDKLHDELDDLCQVNKTDSEAKESWTIASIARAQNLRLPLLLVCALQAGQQFSGINAVFYYSVSIFESAGLSHDGSQYASIGAGGVNLLIAIISIPLVNCCSRRGLTLWSCATAAFFLTMLCICITYIVPANFWGHNRVVQHMSGGWTCGQAHVWSIDLWAGTCLWIIDLWAGTCLWIMDLWAGTCLGGSTSDRAQLFEVSPRPVAMSYGSMANWGGNFVVGMTFPSLQVLIGQYSFLLFAATTVMLAVFLKYYLPETKGRESSDIAEILKHGFLSDINTPPLYTMSQRLASVSSNPSRLRCNSETVSADIVPATDSPSHNVGVLAQNNSYTNLSAIPEQFQAVSDFPKSPTNPHPVHAMMPSIPENLDSSSIIGTGGGKQNIYFRVFTLITIFIFKAILCSIHYNLFFLLMAVHF
uniref:Major facilitator superfamily (MFS) profile domain-containing protein n=1 Tax=Timema shepardi TaxID=629360 RepID=A0A7R9FWP4_TIMSH|nr:unnamed protein product [Timema shepardi]